MVRSNRGARPKNEGWMDFLIVVRHSVVMVIPLLLDHDYGITKVLSKKLPGMRILRQDPAECLLSFICSSNNNVSRIQLILDNVRRTFGKKLHSACVPLDDGSDEQLVDFFAFPSLDTLGRAPLS